MAGTAGNPPIIVAVDGKELEFHNPYNLPYYKKALKVLESVKPYAQKQSLSVYADVYASLLSARHVILGVDGSVIFIRFTGGASHIREYALVVNDLTGFLNPLDIYYPIVRAYNHNRI